MKSFILAAVSATVLLGWPTFAATPFQFTVHRYEIGSNYHDVHAADVNGDGAPDILGSVLSDTAVFVAFNDGSGSLGTPRFYGLLGDRAVAALPADIDADGDIDIVAPCRNVQPLGTKIVTLRNDGDGNFDIYSYSYSIDVYVEDYWPALATGDIDGDGDCDLVVKKFPISVQCLKNDGEGRFSVSETFPLRAADSNLWLTCYSLELKDFNRDNILDLAAGVNASPYPYPSSIELFFGLGNGQFVAESETVLEHYTPKLLSIADFDNNGSVDLAFSNWGLPQYVTILPMSSGEIIGAPVNIASPPGGSNAYGIAVLDLNEDGWLDMATSTSAIPTMDFHINQHDGTFILARGVHHGSGMAARIFAVDMNADGLTDILAENGNQVIVMLKVSCSGDIDADGNIDIADLSRLLAYLYLNGEPLTDIARADFDGEGSIDIADLTSLIGYLYLNGPLPTCP